MKELYEELSTAVLELGEKSGDGTLIFSAPNVRRFLNRLLGVLLSSEYLFGLFADTLNATIKAAKIEGTYTEGVNQLCGQNIAVHGKPNQLVLTEPFHGAACVRLILSLIAMAWDQAFLLYKARGNRYPRDGFWFKKKQWYGKPEIVLALTAPGTDELEMEVYRPNMGQVNNAPRFEFIHENTRIDDTDPGWFIGSGKAKEAWDFIYDYTEFGCRHYGRCQTVQSGGKCFWGSRAERCCIINGAVADHVERTSICLTRNQSTVYSIERTMRVVRVETDLTKRQEEMQPAGVALLPDPNVRETSAEETLNGMSSGDMFEIVGIRYPEKLLPQVVEAAKKNWEDKRAPRSRRSRR